MNNNEEITVNAVEINIENEEINIEQAETDIMFDANEKQDSVVRLKPKVLGKVVYKDITYNILPFDDSHKHVEPCWDCAFGGRCSLGMKEIIVKGEKKQVRENGFTCKRPADFPQCCTCVNREDNRNVYFVKDMKQKTKEVERAEHDYFFYKTVKLKVVAGNPDDCKGCYFLNKKCDCRRSIADLSVVGQCEAEHRKDGKDVVFKVVKQKVEKKGAAQ